MASHNAGEVTIVGGGLVGSLLAIFLERRGHDVVVYERRPDLRGTEQEAGRSINLVITSRGLRALAAVGLENAVSCMTVPVRGRMMHAVDGRLDYQPYGRDDSECNYSISRGELNRMLVTEAERRGVKFHFGHRLAGADLEQNRLDFANETGGKRVTAEAPVVFGADGAGSAVRRALVEREEFEESVEPLGIEYKELAIPAGDGGAFRIERHALHIWPRGELMLMALPNRDGSFTVTLYLPSAGAHSFTRLDTRDAVQHLFETQFPDAVPLIPDYIGTFFANPTGGLATIRCDPWNLGGKVALIGDAAHAVVPFFGQGMNCGFEDISVLDELIDRHGTGNWDQVLPEFAQVRKPHADAIAYMAIENSVEMRDKVGNPAFLLRKQVEHLLETQLPKEYRSRYSMVMYSHIPYGHAFEAGRIQQEILDELCGGLESADGVDLEQARRLVRDKLTPFLDERSIDLGY